MDMAEAPYSPDALLTMVYSLSSFTKHHKKNLELGHFVKIHYSVLSAPWLLCDINLHKNMKSSF